LSPELSPTPTPPLFTLQLFLNYNFFRIWPLIFCQHTIYQIIWPSPGTLLRYWFYYPSSWVFLFYQTTLCVLFYLLFVCISAYANVYFKTTIIKQNIKIIPIAGVPSSQALPGFLITAPPSVCVPAVIGVLVVWIQNQKKKQEKMIRSILFFR